MTDFQLQHRARNLRRRFAEILPPDTATREQAIYSKSHPLILSPHEFVNDTTIRRLGVPLRDRNQHFMNMRAEYQRLKRDLIRPGQIFQQMRQEYREYQRKKFSCYVSIEEVEMFLKIFYPVSDPANPAVNLDPFTFTLAFPFSRPYRRMFDVKEVIDWLSQAGNRQVVVWACNGPVQTAPNTTPNDHEQQIADALFSRQGSLLDYVQTSGTVFSKLQFRAKCKTQKTAHLRVFFARGTAPRWCNGRDWVWPSTARGLRRGTRANANRSLHQDMRTFLTRSHMIDPSWQTIRQEWEVRLGEDGRHEKGGKGLRG